MGIAIPSTPLDISSEAPATIDGRTQRQQSFPCEPTLKVIHTLQIDTNTCPGFNFRSADIISDAATLSTLFVSQEDSALAKRFPSRLGLSSVHDTLFVTAATRRSDGHTEQSGFVKSSIPAWVGPAQTTRGTGSHATGSLFV